jgi:predicted esterase YcpF (UPF0227 family)
MHIIYLHGFNRIRVDERQVNILIDAFGVDNVHAIDLSYIPDEAITQISGYLERFDDLTKVILVGDGLGGFYAQYFSKTYEMSAILISPDIDPAEAYESFLGKIANPHTNEVYVFKSEHLDMYRKYYVDADQPPMCSIIVLIEAIFDDPFLVQRIVNHYTTSALIRVYNEGQFKFRDVLNDIKMLEYIEHDD